MYALLFHIYLYFFDRNPPVCMAEIKNALRFAALGMGPLNLTKPKSICLSGPSGFGKKFLIHAIANELG